MSSARNWRFPWLRRVFFSLSRSRALPYSAGFLLLITISFAGLYTWLTPSDHGVMAGDHPPKDFSFTSGLYFSIITISSLGYGDLRPVGFSRILASVEVILGLSSIGIMIAALTSRRLSHLVSRLFVSDARKRLEEFATSFDELEKQFEALLRKISQAYAPIPGAAREGVDTTLVSSAFRTTSRTLVATCESAYDYFREESVEGNFFDLAPIPSLEQMLRAINDALFMLSQCLVNLPLPSEHEILSDVLKRSDRNNIMDSIESLRKICAIGITHSRDERTLDMFKRVHDTCEKVSNIFFQVPQPELPDQVVDTSPTPQMPESD